VPSASALREFNHTSANMWMYHQLLLRAIAKGSRQFDFGRSSLDSGTYKFKAQWGAKPQPTVWQYRVRYGDVNAVRPTSEKNQKRVEQWKKLPVWLTRLIGPTIVRGIP
jgi:lipid II:glycine glycyltransferase (peptidoglycan interpeptide bridge formation enzyme)